LRFLLGFDKAALDEENVEPLASRFGFHGAWTASGASLDEVFRNFAEAGSALGVRYEFGDCFCGKLVGDLMGTLEAVDGWVSGFLLGNVFSGGFPESGGGLFHVENVVCDLKEKSEGLAKCAEASNIFR
jgi:hypothetical protein